MPDKDRGGAAVREWHGIGVHLHMSVYIGLTGRRAFGGVKYLAPGAGWGVSRAVRLGLGIKALIRRSVLPVAAAPACTIASNTYH